MRKWILMCIAGVLAMFALTGCKDKSQEASVRGLTPTCQEAYDAYLQFVDKNASLLRSIPGMTIEQAKEITLEEFRNASEAECLEERDNLRAALQY